MINEREFTRKVINFFNSLSQEEVLALRKMTMTKKWQEYFNARVYNQKIPL